jgi:hypothetical protein
MSLIGESFKNQLIEEGINPEDVVSFLSKYNRKTNTIITKVITKDKVEHII